MSQSRRWVGGTAVVAVLLVLASYFLLIAPKQAHAADLRTQAQTERQANDQLKLDIAQLKVEHASLPARQAELAVIQQQMPSSPNLPSLIRSLTSIAGESGVTLNSIAPAAPQPFTPTAPASTGAATATTAAAPAGLTEIPVTIIVQGDYASAELFLQKVQTQMRRAFLVQSLSLGPAASATTGAAAPAAGTISTTLTGDVFVLQPTASGTSTSASGSTPASGSSN
jgi:Tfp pilus assembly protein PilO